MNFNKRLIIQFILQHVFVLVTLLIAVIASFSYLIFLLNSTLYEPNISDYDTFTISEYISSEDNNITLKSKVKDLITEKSDWLQIVDEDGKVLYNFNTPNDVPTSYTKTSLLTYLQNSNNNIYKFNYWEIKLEKKPVIVIYGAKLKSNALLKTIQQGHPSLSLNEFALTEQEKQLLSKEKATLQIFNNNGEEVFPINWEEKNIFGYKNSS